VAFEKATSWRASGRTSSHIGLPSYFRALRSVTTGRNMCSFRSPDPFLVGKPGELCQRQHRIAICPGEGRAAKSCETGRYGDVSRQGRRAGKVRLFRGSACTRGREKMALERELRQACCAPSSSCIVKHQVDLRTLRVSGRRTRLRWNHPTRACCRGFFIGVAEETGLIEGNRTGGWIGDACPSMRAWRATGSRAAPDLGHVSGEVSSAAAILQVIESALSAKRSAAQARWRSRSPRACQDEKRPSGGYARTARKMGVPWRSTISEPGTCPCLLSVCRWHLKIDKSFHHPT